jgi:hypothetical protein
MMPMDTVRLTPVIVINRRTATSSITLSAISRSRAAWSFADVPLDRHPLVVRHDLSYEPRPATLVEEVGVRALRNEVRRKDRMHFVLHPCPVPHDLIAPRHQSPQSFCGSVRRPNYGG